MSEMDYESTFDGSPLIAYFQTSKKTIQEYVAELDKYNTYKTVQSQLNRGVVLDDRGRLIDLYEACVQQDAHLRSVLETILSQLTGERYMMASIGKDGNYVKNTVESEKIQGTQFVKIIKGIAEAKWYGYTGLEIMSDIDPITGKLKEVNEIERRNICPNQERIVQRQGQWTPGWDFEANQYKWNYILINTGELGIFSATTPLILAKKYTLANYVNFSHTYGQPIIHGKTASNDYQDRKKLADEIANAAQKKIVITGLDDIIDIKAFTMSNSEKIYTSLLDFVNTEVSNVMVGSSSIAGATQSYVGSTNAHQDVFRDRITVYREFIENIMNEEVVPRLVKMGYLAPGFLFKYAKTVEMNNSDKIELYKLLTKMYEVDNVQIEKEFGVVVGKQIIQSNVSTPLTSDNNNIKPTTEPAKTGF